MDRITHFIEQWTGLPVTAQRQIFLSVIIMVLLFIIRRWILGSIRRRIEDVSHRYYWQRITTYTIVILAILIIARIWFAGIEPIFAYFGIVSAGLAIALTDTIANLAGWLFILLRRPFLVGDRVEIGGLAGDVIDIRLFQFSLLEVGNWVDADQSTGRIVHVPNGKVMREPLANYTKGFRYIWHEIPVLVTFESNWREAKQILEKIAEERVHQLSEDAEEQIRQAARQYMIFYGKLTPKVFLTVKDCGVLLTLRYMVNPRRRRNTEEEIWEAVLDLFGQHDDIDFAYPTVRYYDNRNEGKEGMRT
ncbi:mechanosensitive ion channel family protein [Candidatus Zixiibacteriota bacterium]